MHTFFVNTSSNELENYSDIFEIQHETRRLISLECPIAEWNDAEKGYAACVRKMEELIDSYKDINNDFNLIVYVDLLPYDIYTSIPAAENRERGACLMALRSVLKHYIKCTFINEMEEHGRKPKEVLLIFEENQLSVNADKQTDDGKNLIRSYTREVLGLPSDDDICRIAYGTGEVGEEQQIREKILDCAHSCIGEYVLHTYLKQVNIFIENAKEGILPDKMVTDLLDSILECASKDGEDKDILLVSFKTNRRTGATNKQEKTRRDLRLSFYVLACVEQGTVFAKASGDKTAVRSFAEIKWEDALKKLAAKRTAFRKMYSNTQKLTESFSELELAPDLFQFDNQRFALDEYGRLGKNLDVVDIEEAKDEEQEQKEADSGIVKPDGKKAVVVTEAKGHSMFTDKEYPLFDYSGYALGDSALGSKATAEQYVTEAQKMRRHHLDYLQRLKVHVSDRLSNYAGRSAENASALLGKRNVSVAEEDFETEIAGGDYHYAKAGRPVENKRLETVESLSKAAYTSTLLRYMEFCAGRSVAVTDIEEQCNWFVTRVNQIKESLRKLQLVAIGLLFAIIVLYIPFVVIQWEAITENAVTVFVALMSIAVPVVILYLIFAIASSMQRKKFRKAWDEFKEKSDEILKENAAVAEKYDLWLSEYIPALRWVYEYKLDVEFYVECCKMARAKIGHHIQKLHDRVVTVGNIIEDLEADIATIDVGQADPDGKLDYNVAFCSGKNNRDFYSIIDKQFLETINQL